MGALAGCAKQGVGDAMGPPADVKLQAAQGGPTRSGVPALFVSIPADTPYLLASLESAPPELWEKMGQRFKPVIDLIAAKWQEKRGTNKVFEAMLGELAGKWSEAGLESLGFSGQPRFAMYGLGLQPFVIRMAIKDGKAVRATIERIAAKAGDPLPPIRTRGGRGYWQDTGRDGTATVVSVDDHELIVAAGKPRDIEDKLDLILGLQKPARNMADGALVKRLMAGHRLGGQLIGFADTRQLAGKALEAAGSLPGPAGPDCTGEIDRLSAMLPRLVFGYSELSSSRIAGRLVVEMAPELVAELRALKTEVPGLGTAMAGHPIMAFAAAMDLVGAQQLAIAAAANLQQLGTACGLGPLANGAAQVAGLLSRPLPDLVGQISGGAAVIDDIVVRPGGRKGTPEKIEGVLLIASPDARALFGKAIELEPQLKSLGIEADGKLHDLRMPVPVFGVPAVGVGDHVLLVTAGNQQRGAGDKLIAARGGDKAPLLAGSYDFRKLMDFTEQTGNFDAMDRQPEFRVVMEAFKDALGNFWGTVDVTDRGLALWSAVELK